MFDDNQDDAPAFGLCAKRRVRSPTMIVMRVLTFGEPSASAVAIANDAPPAVAVGTVCVEAVWVATVGATAVESGAATVVASGAT
jgi:hypothetical protein